MRSLLLIRHAESQFNAKETGDLDSDLTKRGREQANEVGAYLKRAFDDIDSWKGYVSPYFRTLQTAKFIKSHTGVNFQVDLRLAEYHHSTSGFKLGANGRYKPFEITLRSDMFPEFFGPIERRVWSQKPENEVALLSRLMEFLDQLEGKCIIVSHAMPIYAMVHILQGYPMVPKWDRKILNTSVTWFEDGKLKKFAKFVNSGKDPRPDTMCPIMFV